MARIPYMPDTPITGSLINSAVQRIRMDTIQSIKWDIRPSIGLVAKDIERLGLDIKSFREPLTIAVKEVIIPSIRKNFKVGGRPPWAPLAPFTVKVRGTSEPILVLTGLLQARATQFDIWDIGATTATVRRLPDDVFYGAFHQAGAGSTRSGIDELMAHKPGSHGAMALINRFMPRARAELGANADPAHLHNRAVGMLMDADLGWQLPARPFIMWQDQDIPKILVIFSAWMEREAIKVGRFHRE